jgi:hypothetical protein
MLRRAGTKADPRTIPHLSYYTSAVLSALEFLGHIPQAVFCSALEHVTGCSFKEDWPAEELHCPRPARCRKVNLVSNDWSRPCEDLFRSLAISLTLPFAIA